MSDLRSISVGVEDAEAELTEAQIEPSADLANPEIFLDVLHDELDAAGWLP